MDRLFTPKFATTMLGISYIKFDAMTYVIHFKNGHIATREGRGLSFILRTT
jgi:D-alanyl-lipoteichoic acid acyltransferase DltB (MBOAT superfamily)